MHIEFLVEELSAEEALKNILPKILGGLHSFRIHPFNGKDVLFRKLENRLRGYANWLPPEFRIVVLVDLDDERCRELKSRMDEIAEEIGLTTKRVRPQGQPSFQVLNRIAIEELEAWFFGDIDAVVQAYPNMPFHLGQSARYRDPDAISGGTWEALEKELQKKGYFRGGLRKIELARNISKYMNPESNRSRSFQVFRTGLLELVNN